MTILRAAWEYLVLLVGAALFARLARHVPNDPLRRLLTRAGEELHRGGRLLLFPEGTRTNGGVPVQVVFIETQSEFLGKGRSVFARPSLPLAYRVRLGRRFEPPIDVRAFTEELGRHFLRELASPVAAAAAGHERAPSHRANATATRPSTSTRLAADTSKR